MSRAEAARREEAAIDLDRRLSERPNRPAPAIRPDDPRRCAAAGAGRFHDYTMRGPDGVRRCWYCCARKPEAA